MNREKKEELNRTQQQQGGGHQQDGDQQQKQQGGQKNREGQQQQGGGSSEPTRHPPGRPTPTRGWLVELQTLPASAVFSRIAKIQSPIFDGGAHLAASGALD